MDALMHYIPIPYYLIIAFVVWVGTAAYAYFTDDVVGPVFGAIIGFGAGVLWPLTLAIFIVAGIVKLIDYIYWNYI